MIFLVVAPKCDPECDPEGEVRVDRVHAKSWTSQGAHHAQRLTPGSPCPTPDCPGHLVPRVTRFRGIPERMLGCSSFSFTGCRSAVFPERMRVDPGSGAASQSSPASPAVDGDRATNPRNDSLGRVPRSEDSRLFALQNRVPLHLQQRRVLMSYAEGPGKPIFDSKTFFLF